MWNADIVVRGRGGDRRLSVRTDGIRVPVLFRWRRCYFRKVKDFGARSRRRHGTYEESTVSMSFSSAALNCRFRKAPASSSIWETRLAPTSAEVMLG